MSVKSDLRKIVKALGDAVAEADREAAYDADYQTAAYFRSMYERREQEKREQETKGKE